MDDKTVAKNHQAVIRKILREYADRGVFGGFSENEARGGKTTFEFNWLHNRRFEVVFDERADTVQFKNALPHIQAKSPVYKSVKEFIASRSDTKLPAHRRIDTKRAEAKCVSRGGSVSLVMRVKNNQYTYGVRKLVNLLHETFIMIDQEHTEYLYEHFDLPEE